MKASILVVDDDRIILELASIVLRSAGYTVQGASDGMEALHLLAAGSFDLVLLDYTMPGKDGLEVLGEIKEKYPDTAVIIFTGMGSEDVAVRAMKAGAADYMMKPFRNHDLVERVATVLRSRKFELYNRELIKERDRHHRQMEEWNLELEKRIIEKSLELESIHAEMIHVEKLATLGHFSASLAHEIRNPLNSINLFAQILKNDRDASPQGVEFLERIQAEVDRIDNLLIKLLSVSHSQNRNSSPLQVDAIALEVLNDFQPKIAAQQIRLQQTIVPTPTFHGDAEEVRQVFTNLVCNALHAMTEGGELKMTVTPKEGAIVIEISDTGCGIPLEHQARVFDPFFTTRPKGTGFGLSVVLRIIKTYNGKIAMSSQPGAGTSFSILLPLAEGRS